MTPRQRRMERLRLAVQLLAFGLLIWGGFGLAALDGRSLAPSSAGGAPPPRFATPPAGAVQLFLPATVCIYQRRGLCRGCSLYFASDSLSWLPPLERWLPHAFLLLLAVLLAGRLWCGWICPLGLLSDLLTRARLLLRLPQRRLGPRLRDALVFTKYGLLLLALAVAALASLPQLADSRLGLVDPFCRICPARIFTPLLTFDRICWTDFSSPSASLFTWLGLLAFALFFTGFAVRRFWCRLCPIGGLSALFHGSGLVGLVKETDRCTRCGACQRLCPLDVRAVYEARHRGPVTASECHLCLRCVAGCPEPGALRFTWLGRKVTGS